MGVESYTTITNLSIRDLIQRRIPSGLKILLLDSITIPPPYGYLKMHLFLRDKELIRSLIEQKQILALRLRYILMYYLEAMKEPTNLYDPADEHGMEICGLYETDVINPPWE